MGEPSIGHSNDARIGCIMLDSVGIPLTAMIEEQTMIAAIVAFVQAVVAAVGDTIYWGT